MVVERCFDDSEGSQLIIHAPFGGRINRALGLALRKRFCVSFDFELQAAADDDTVVLSLGPQHSFPLTKVQSMLSSAKAHRGADPGRAAPPHARRALALEPQPRPGAAPHERRQAPADPPAAHGGRRPAGRRVAGPGRLPGERAAGPGRRARPRAGPPDGRRLPARGALGRGPGRRLVPGRVGCDRGAHGRVVRALALLPRHPERAALHLSRRRAARGAAHAGPVRCGAAWASWARTGCPSRPRSWRRSTPRPWRSCSTRSARGCATPTSCTTSCSPWWRRGRTAEWAQWFDALAADGRAGTLDGCWVATERRQAAWRWGRRRGCRGLRGRATCSWPAR